MFSDTPHSGFLQRKRSVKSGFTLIELLMVIAVILLLASLTFGISRGVQNAQARARAKADLAVLGQALEGYKSAHGDYPWTSNANELAQALMGWWKFEDGDFLEVTSVPATGPKSFIDPTRLDYSGTLPASVSDAPGTGAFRDPWGEEYVYEYKTSATGSWDNFGFVLYSKGPDGEDSPVGGDGVLTPTIRDSSNNIDNIYSGE